MSLTKFIISAFFLDSVAALPSGSGPGITVHEAQNRAGFQNSFTCTTSQGVTYSGGSSIMNTNIHQMAVCTGPNHWNLSVYPTDCNIRNQNWCWDNCAHNFSGTCSYYCTCLNDLGASGPKLGASGSTYGDLPIWPNGPASDDVKLGHSDLGHSGGSCPWWLPQAIGQLSPGMDGFSCYSPGQLCKYPSYGMNFNCQHGVWHLESGNQCPSWFQIWSGAWCPTNGALCKYPQQNENFMCTNGQWQLQSSPPIPSPTPPPTGCPSWGNIWNGDNCPTNGVLCNYPRYFENFMCTNGKWQLQTLPGPPVPSPTPAPANPANCPVKAYPPSNNGFCSPVADKLLCRYPTGTFKCNNGRWKKLYY